jgi:hypothetical protein
LLSCRKKGVDARDNPRIKSGDGHDGEEAIPSHRNAALVMEKKFDVAETFEKKGAVPPLYAAARKISCSPKDLSMIRMNDIKLV